MPAQKFRDWFWLNPFHAVMTFTFHFHVMYLFSVASFCFHWFAFFCTVASSVEAETADASSLPLRTPTFIYFHLLHFSPFTLPFLHCLLVPLRFLLLPASESHCFLFQLYCTFANLIRYICTSLRLAGSNAFGGCKLGMWATKGFILQLRVCASYTRMTIFLMWSLRDMSVGQVLFDLPTVKRNQVLFENVVN